MRILILEDDTERHKKFRENLIGHKIVIVTQSNQAIKLLQAEKFEVLFLDHDLGDQIYVESGLGTGYEVAKWISENMCYKPTIVYLQ